MIDDRINDPETTEAAAIDPSEAGGGGSASLGSTGEGPAMVEAAIDPGGDSGGGGQ
jgi:hypothetical protein